MQRLRPLQLLHRQDVHSRDEMPQLPGQSPGKSGEGNRKSRKTMEGPRRKSVIITGGQRRNGQRGYRRDGPPGLEGHNGLPQPGEGGRRAPQNPGSRTLRAARDSGIAPRLVRLDKGTSPPGCGKRPRWTPCSTTRERSPGATRGQSKASNRPSASTTSGHGCSQG